MSADSSADSPVFSLVLATLGTEHKLGRFMESLLRQDKPSVQLIVVDQNKGSEVEELLQAYQNAIEIIHVRCRPGLSLARNVGLQHIRGRIVAFPDDDCWYPDGLLDAVEHRLADRNIDGITCRCTDADGRLAAGGDDRRAGVVTKANVWRRGVSATLFLKRKLVDEIGTFDTALGLGSATVFQSGEETDYLLRAITLGWRLFYDPSLRVHHPCPPPNHTARALYKSWSYGLGMGCVLQKHNYGLIAVCQHLVTPMAGALCAVLCGDFSRAKIRWVRTLGRWRGWRWEPGQRSDLVCAPDIVFRSGTRRSSLT